MFWKSTCSAFGILLTSVSFAKETPQIKPAPKPQVNQAQKLHDMIAAALERQKQRAADFANSQKASSKSLFAPMVQAMQPGINARVNQLASSMPTTLPTVQNDLAALTQLYSGYQANSSLKAFVAYCNQVYAQAQANVTAASTDAAQRTVLQQAWQDIGQGVFLAERFPSQMNSIVTASATTTQQNILNRCSMEIQKVVGQCQVFADLQQASGLQDAGLSLGFYEAMRIAKLLLTNTGKLNLGMVPLLRAAFVPTQSPLEYQVGMDRVLSTMNSGWQPAMDAIMKPQCAAAEMVVRADLEISTSVPLTNQHSKIAALKGLLSHLNQGAVGDCFAVSWAIKKHNEYFLQSLKDYADLLSGGYLTRMANGQPDQFFFKNTLADNDLTTPVKLGSTGVLGTGGVIIWEAPGILAACTLMGLDKVEPISPSIIKSLLGSAKSIQTTPAQIIAAFAAYSVQQNPKLDLATQTALGRYGFSLSQNHLLRAWETALASMAEATSGDYVHDQVLSTLQTVMAGEWIALKNSLPISQQAIVTQLQTDFITAFNQLTHYVYDADIPLAQVSSDGSSTDGGFEMYKIASQSNTIGQIVQTPADLSTHLVEVIQQGTAAVMPSLTSASDQAALNQVAGMVCSYVQSSTFLKALFYAYDSNNQKIADPVANYQTLSSSPMLNLVGDNPYAVQAIDNGVAFTPDIKTFNPQNPYALIKWILDLAKWKEQTQSYIEKGSPAELDPAMGPDHAFTINFEEPEIEAYVKSSVTSDQYLSQYAIQPNMKIAQAMIDANTKQTFTNNFLSWLQQNSQLSQSDLNYVNSVVSKFNQQSLSVQAYAANFLSTIDQMFRLTGTQASSFSVPFDAIFLLSLPAATQQALAQTAIRFANTNWDQGDKDLYFCTFFNPRTATLGFATIAEDRTMLNVMDEYQWVDQQEWDVAPVDQP